MKRWGRGTWKLAALTLTIAGLWVVTATVGAQSGSKPLAVVNGEAITVEEVDEALRPQLSKLEEHIYELKRQRLDAIIRDRLLAQEAQRRGISVQALMDAEVTSKVGLVTEQEIEKIFQANRARIKGDEAEARDRIRSMLQNQRLTARRDEFAQSLRDRAQVVVNLQAPPVTRMEVSVGGAPAKGPATAPVTIVEFSDFHCPFCKRVLPTLDQITSRYGDRVRLVFRDLPLDQLHPAARRAHEAARCAHEQGKFWAYHDVLFDNAPRAADADLRAYAKQVGLDTAQFDSCLDDKKYAAAVQKDVEEAGRLGVTGTPAFFINGRLLSGAQPLDAFLRIIEDELERVARK